MNLTVDNQGRRVEMIVIPYTTVRRHAGRRGSPAIPAGTTIFVLKYAHPEGGYFTYSYLNREDAELCIRNGKDYGTNTEFYMQWNRVIDPENTMHYGTRRRTCQ